MYKKPTIHDVIGALAPLEKIERPDADNEGCAINSNSVYPYLSSEEQKLVDNAEKVLDEYTRKHGTPNKRSITELKKHGFDADLYEDQYDPDRLVGMVKLEDSDWSLNISDPSIENDDD